MLQKIFSSKKRIKAKNWKHSTENKWANEVSKPIECVTEKNWAATREKNKTQDEQRKMVVLESGLIVNGMPVIRTEYSKTNNNIDPFIRTGLFTAIQTFAAKAFSDQAEEMKLRKHTLLIKDVNPGNGDQMFLYLIAEKGTDLGEVRKRLENIKKKVDFGALVIASTIMTKELEAVKKVIEKELRDLTQKPADRAKNVFG